MICAAWAWTALVLSHLVLICILILIKKRPFLRAISLHILVNKEGDAHHAEQEHQHRRRHEELVNAIHASILLGLVLDLAHRIIVLLLQTCLLFRVAFLLYVFGVAHIAEAFARECYVIPRTLIESHFKLDILEIADLARSHVVVLNWFASCEATSSVNPTVLIQVRIMAHFDEDANLRHGFVTVTKVVAFQVDASMARRLTLSLELLPDIEVDAVLRVVWLNLSASGLDFRTIW